MIVEALSEKKKWRGIKNLFKKKKYTHTHSTHTTKMCLQSLGEPIESQQGRPATDGRQRAHLS